MRHRMWASGRSVRPHAMTVNDTVHAPHHWCPVTSSTSVVIVNASHRGCRLLSRPDGVHRAADGMPLLCTAALSEFNPRNRAAASPSDTTAYFALPREAERWYERRDQTLGGSVDLRAFIFVGKRISGPKTDFGSSEQVYVGGATGQSGLQHCTYPPVEDGL
jgi:hypothetical protein